MTYQPFITNQIVPQDRFAWGATEDAAFSGGIRIIPLDAFLPESHILWRILHFVHPFANCFIIDGYETLQLVKAALAREVES